MNKRKDELAPCGAFCMACPSYKKSCLGCSSDNKDQKRKSKWSCKIRLCCYEKKHIDYCAYCEDFPCKTIDKKIIKSHEGDYRFKYRHEIPDNLKKIKLLGIDEFIEQKKKDFTCKYCGGTVFFYYYKCNQCGEEVVQ
jgi:hypothetical protein